MNRKTIKLLALLCVIASCSKTIEHEGDIPGSSKPPMMTFASALPSTRALPQTRAFITKNMLETDGAILRIADIYSGTTNVSSYTQYPFFGREGGLFMYQGGDWVKYESQTSYGGHYYWTETGTHKFFGWARGVKLNPDDAGNTAVDRMITNYDLHVSENPSHLDIKNLTLTDDVTPQFDFIYTDVVMRNLDTPANSYPAAQSKYAAVPLTFHHLFSALAVTIENQSPQPLYVEDLKISGLKTTTSAIITFNDINLQDPTAVGSGSTPSIPSQGSALTEKQGGFIQSTISGTVPARATDAAGTTTYSKLDVFSKNAQGVSQLLGSVSDAQGNAKDSEARLLWPQDVTRVTLTLTYKTDPSATETKTKTVELDYTDHQGGSYHLGSGEKYRINLLFKGDNVPLSCSLNVLPWDSEESTLDIAIKCDPSLSLMYVDETGADQVLYSLPTDGSAPGTDVPVTFPAIQHPNVKCTFTPVAPQGGDWSCEIIGGSTDCFTFVGSMTDALPDPAHPTEKMQDASGNLVDDPQYVPAVTRATGTIDGQSVSLLIRPTLYATRLADETITLRFHIRSANVDADATATYNPLNYQITLPANN